MCLIFCTPALPGSGRWVYSSIRFFLFSGGIPQLSSLANPGAKVQINFNPANLLDFYDICVLYHFFLIFAVGLLLFAVSTV